MRALISLAVVLMLATATVPAGDKPPKVPTLNDLAAVWVGEAPQGAPEFFRLDLRSDGTGLVTVQYLANEPAVAYAITHTVLSKYSIRFELKVDDPSTEPVSVHGQALSTVLTLDFRSDRLGWKRKVWLRRHSDFMKRLDAVTKRAQEYLANHKD